VDGATGTLVLAFQVWDGVGWAARAVWTWRMVHQWWLSEKHERSVLPPSFWSWSLLGSALDLAYLFHRRDPVFVSGTLVNASIYARNLWMSRRPPTAAPRPRRVVWPVLAGLVLFAAIVVEAIGPNHGLVRFDRELAWLVVGFLGQVAWTGRFVVQWWESEKRGVSHLPASFFLVGLVGAAMLLGYALSQKDWVMTFAFGSAIVPYARNLQLLRREADAPRAPDA
jgi:lipid-A-disaccharide synthase-like uncharacterized protein